MHGDGDFVKLTLRMGYASWNDMPNHCNQPGILT
jgi:hypothetical protein